jgi:hypothetical protein
MSAIPMPMTDGEVGHALEIARAMATAGIPVFAAPPNPTKKYGYDFPLGWNTVTPSAHWVDQWRPGWALCAIGGAVCDFLDVDPRNGGDLSAAELAKAGYWPHSYGRALTPSGGTHDIIAPLGVGKGIPAPGVDLQGGRADDTGRGFIFLAPTVRASKIDGVRRTYRWVHEPDLAGLRARGPIDRSGAELARRLLAGRKPRRPAMAEAIASGDADDFFNPGLEPSYVNARIRGHLDAITEHARRGGELGAVGWSGFRNLLALEAAYEIGGYVGAGHLTYQDAYDALLGAIIRAGQVPNDDDRLWIEQGLGDGASRPLKVAKVLPPLVPGQDDAPTGAPRRLPLILADFWLERPWLTAIRDRAWQTDDCPDAVLGAFLGIYAASLSHRIKIDTGIRRALGMSLLVGLVAPSGQGKSSAWDLAWRELAPAECPPVSAIPTGEGLIEAFMGPVEEYDPATTKSVKKRAQVTNNAVYYVDEGVSLTAAMAREGSSIGPVMRAVFSDALLGNQNADAERRRLVAAGSYSVGIVIGFQETTVLPVLRDLNTGMAQRFLWFSALCDSTEPSGLMAISRPEMPPLTPLRQVVGMDGEATYLLDVEPEITTMLRRESARKRATIDITKPDPDSQRPALVGKLAGLFCLIDHRVLITMEDWRLAERLYAASCAVRDELLALAEEQDDLEQRDRAAKQGQADRTRKNYQTEAARVVEVLVKRLTKHNRPHTRRELNHAVESKDRVYFQGALDECLKYRRIMKEGGKYILAPPPKE